ncbi:assembly protein [Enterobacteria phage PRDfuchsia]
MAGKSSNGDGVKFADDAGSGNSIDGIAIIDPGTVTSASGGSGSDAGSCDSGNTPRKRGRPAGSGTGAKRGRPAGSGAAKKVPGNLGVEKILFSLHLMASSALKVEELALDEKEAEALAGAVQEVASHYDITPDPKIMAWAGLFGVCASIYGPRIAAYKMRAASEKRDKKEAAKPMAQKVQEAKPTEHDPAAPYIEQLPVSNLL